MNLVHDFDEVVNRRGTDSKKYSVYPEDVIPMWIADSDFKAPQPVVDALVDLKTQTAADLVQQACSAEAGSA